MKKLTVLYICVVMFTTNILAQEFSGKSSTQVAIRNSIEEYRSQIARFFQAQVSAAAQAIADYQKSIINMRKDHAADLLAVELRKDTQCAEKVNVCREDASVKEKRIKKLKEDKTELNTQLRECKEVENEAVDGLRRSTEHLQVLKPLTSLGRMPDSLPEVDTAKILVEGVLYGYARHTKDAGQKDHVQVLVDYPLFDAYLIKSKKTEYNEVLKDKSSMDAFKLKEARALFNRFEDVFS